MILTSKICQGYSSHLIPHKPRTPFMLFTYISNHSSTRMIPENHIRHWNRYIHTYTYINIKIKQSWSYQAMPYIHTYIHININIKQSWFLMTLPYHCIHTYIYIWTLTQNYPNDPISQWNTYIRNICTYKHQHNHSHNTITIYPKV